MDHFPQLVPGEQLEALIAIEHLERERIFVFGHAIERVSIGGHYFDRLESRLRPLGCDEGGADFSNAALFANVDRSGPNSPPLP